MVLALVAVTGAAAFVFLIVVLALQGLDRAGAWAAPLAALGVGPRANAPEAAASPMAAETLKSRTLLGKR